MTLVLYELDGHIATITLNRPEKHNAINGALREELNAAWDRFGWGAVHRLWTDGCVVR